MSVRSAGKAGQASVHEIERRRSRRMAHVVEAWICSPTSANPERERVDVRSIDLSRDGVSFSFVRPLPTRAFYTMQIGVGADCPSAEIRIISCQEQADGTYRVGAEFV